MSIISTVYIPEGIIMASDSRLTGTTTFQNGNVDRLILSDNSQKLFLLEKVGFGIACCGEAIISGKSVGDFLRIFEINEVLETDTVEQVAIKLKDYTMKQHGNGVIYYVCGYCRDEPFVYKIIFDSIMRSNIEKSDIDYGFAWGGEVEALNKLILADPQIQLNFNLMQLKDGIDFAEFLIDVTIKYQRFDMRLATCGGSVDILVITKDYAKFIKHKILTP